MIYTEDLDSIKTVMQSLKDTVANLKSELAEMKKGMRKCDFCGEYGHTKKMCRKNPDSENYKKSGDS